MPPRKKSDVATNKPAEVDTPAESGEPSPTDAAIAEASDSNDIKVPFRDATITVRQSARTSARFLIAARTNHLTALVELLGDEAGKFIDQCKPGEELVPVVVEFFEAMNKVTGSGNS
jgi:hypothetical protein